MQTKINKQNAAYKMELPQETISDLAKRGLDTERFQRDLLQLQNRHPEKTIVLTDEIKQKLIDAQHAMNARAQTQEQPVLDEIRDANMRLAKIRQEAQSRRELAAQQEQDKVLSMLLEVYQQTTLNMNSSNYALHETSDYIKRLQQHTKGKTHAQELTVLINSEFAKQEKRMDAREINASEYIANCKKILEANAIELNKPQTLIEAVRNFVFNGLRKLFNLFDRFYTWILSNEKTLAENPKHQPFIPVPKTTLAVELESIQKDIVRLEKDLDQQIAEEQKRTQHQEKRQSVKAKPENPKNQKEIKTEKRKEAAHAAEEKATALTKETPHKRHQTELEERQKLKDAKTLKWKQRHEKKEAALNEKVRDILRTESRAPSSIGRLFQPNKGTHPHAETTRTKSPLMRTQ